VTTFYVSGTYYVDAAFDIVQKNNITNFYNASLHAPVVEDAFLY